MDLEHEYKSDGEDGFYDEHLLDGEEPSEDIEVVSPALKAKLRRLVEARAKHDIAKAAVKTAKEELDQIELEVFDIFEKVDGEGNPAIKGSLKVNLGEPYGWQSFRTRETHFAKIVDDEEAQEWYEQRAQLEEVSAPKFVMKRLSGDIRDALDQGLSPGDEGWPKGLTYTTSRGMTITAQKD